MSSVPAPLTHGPTVHKHSRVNSPAVLFLLCTTCQQSGVLGLKIEGRNRHQQLFSCLDLRLKCLIFLHCHTTMINHVIHVSCWIWAILVFQWYSESWISPHLMQGNAPSQCFQLVVREGRKEEKMSVYQKALIYCLYILPPINRWRLFIVQGWNISPISYNVIIQYYVTFENRIITVESNCCSGVLFCWLHFMDGDFQQIAWAYHVSSHISSLTQWSSGHTAALLLWETWLQPGNPVQLVIIQFPFKSITEIYVSFSPGKVHDSL